MDSFKDSLAFWSSILGTVVGLFGLVESLRWVAILGLLFVACSVAALFYAHTQRRRLLLSGVQIEGRSIDSLNLASLGRRLNRSLVVQEADQQVTIRGADMVLKWRYTGYCRAPRESVIEFSVDTENNVPFERFECFAYDLRHDPNRMHRIRPLLISADGLSKKIAMPFLEPLAAMQPFSVLLECKLPGSLKTGIEYYVSTMSVAQDRVPTAVVRLVFQNVPPKWLRVYERDTSGKIRLIKELKPRSERFRRASYEDVGTNIPAQSARIYVFLRSIDKDTSIHPLVPGHRAA